MSSLLKFEDCQEQIENLRKYGKREIEELSRLDAEMLTRLILSLQGELEAFREEAKNPGYLDRQTSDFDENSQALDKKIKALARDQDISYAQAFCQIVKFGEVD